uniref:Uncharacterized protein n=1 Tax=Anguilla anguilla TaxID=7936 RepID=A0A0E9UQ73_ANGAN
MPPSLHYSGFFSLCKSPLYQKINKMNAAFIVKCDLAKVNGIH